MLFTVFEFLREQMIFYMYSLKTTASNDYEKMKCEVSRFRKTNIHEELNADGN